MVPARVLFSATEHKIALTTLGKVIPVQLLPSPENPGLHAQWCDP